MTAPEVTVIGSVNVDLIVRVDRLPEPGTTVTGGVFERQSGGKGANQAVSAAQKSTREWLRVNNVRSGQMARCHYHTGASIQSFFKLRPFVNSR